MPDLDVIAFVRASLAPPPARVLEIGAGSGELAALLREAGYDVLAIDPEPGGPGVAEIALLDVDEPAASFDAAVAVVSLHHVEPLAPSCARLAALLRRGARLVVDEFDVAAFDARAAAWWLEQRAALGKREEHTPEGLVERMREHLHSLAAIREALSGGFASGEPVPCPYLYRWYLDPALWPRELELIAAGALPAVGARLVAVRHPG